MWKAWHWRTPSCHCARSSTGRRVIPWVSTGLTQENDFLMNLAPWFEVHTPASDGYHLALASTTAIPISTRPLPQRIDDASAPALASLFIVLFSVLHFCLLFFPPPGFSDKPRPPPFQQWRFKPCPTTTTATRPHPRPTTIATGAIFNLNLTWQWLPMPSPGLSPELRCTVPHCWSDVLVQEWHWRVGPSFITGRDGTDQLLANFKVCLTCVSLDGSACLIKGVGNRGTIYCFLVQCCLLICRSYALSPLLGHPFDACRPRWLYCNGGMLHVSVAGRVTNVVCSVNEVHGCQQVWDTVQVRASFLIDCVTNR